jgi:sugar/nucleoside kinase (ribokinase family)
LAEPKLDLVTVGNLSIDSIKIGKYGAKKVPGGSAGAVVTAAAALNNNVGIVTKIGEDYPIKWLIDLGGRGIDLTGVSTQKSSCRFELKYDHKNNLKHFREIFNAEDIISNQDIPGYYFNSKFFHLSAAHPRNQQKMITRLKRAPKTKFSITLWPTYQKEYSPYFINRLNEAEVLFCNNYEIQQLSNEENIYDAAKKISKGGPKVIVLTKGAKGAAIYHKGEFLVYPALRTNIIDTTGCGDSFAAGFLVEYLQSKDIEKAGWVGAAMASFTISKVGSWFPMLNELQIERRIEGARKNSGSKTPPKKATLMDFY